VEKEVSTTEEREEKEVLTTEEREEKEEREVSTLLATPAQVAV
jgi:hypothetical protein